MAAPLVKHRRTTLERAEKFTSKDYFTDVNLRSRLYTNRKTIPGIFHHAAKGRVSFQSATKGEFSPVKVGDSYGPTWSTHWFRLQFTIPPEWKSQQVLLQWVSGSEALVWSNDGVPLQGLNHDKRTEFILGDDYKTMTGEITLYVEMACNTINGAGDYLIGPPKPDMTFTLSKCDLVTLDLAVDDIIFDIELLADIAREFGETDQRSLQALHTVNHMVNLCTMDKQNGLPRAKEVADRFFQQKNGDSQFTIHAMGHAHIDAAWLWPYAETVRKCARTWSTVLRLMERYPDFVFVCSQAQQFAWVKENYPALFKKIKSRVAEGRFIPVGGTWVEMDGNLPSGESFIRQFLHGQRFFLEEFGAKCSEFWLPDTFGYSAQLPQLMNGVGIHRFLTQKLSWSLVNKFPHSTFWWQGLDGSRSLSHFPPADDYGTRMTMKQILKTRDGHKDKGRTNNAMMLFGYGDGGGGPTEFMLRRVERLHDTDGIPKLKSSTPAKFFQQVEESEADNLCTWVGELYLELHQGTFTSQASIKKWNRRCEITLQNVEKVYSLLGLLNGPKSSYPYKKLDQCWKNVLLNQFHDVLPGSSIQMVNEEACRIYEQVNAEVNTLVAEGLTSISTGTWNRKRKASTEVVDWRKSTVVFNPHSWKRSEVICIPADEVKLLDITQGGNDVQYCKNGNVLAYVETPSFGLAPISAILSCNYDNQESLRQWKKFDSGHFILENEILRAEIDSCGLVRSLIHKESGLDAFSDDSGKGIHGNQFLIYDDIPLFWDAWDVMDYHLETRKPITTIIATLQACDTDGHLRQSVKFKLQISDRSWIEQEISLDRKSSFLRFQTTVNWHENHKFLKVEFPFNVHSAEATFEIQFGHLKRPTHTNTSWDWARYEVVGHKWADISQHDWGVALLNDCKYGHSTSQNIMRLSLLKSAKNPDANADMGIHHFSYAVFPHRGTFQEAGVIQAAYDFNNPLTVSSGKLSKELSAFSVDNPAIILETVKFPERTQDQHGQVLVLRFYEAYGSHAKGNLLTPFHISRVTRCNLLEEAESQIVTQENSFTLDLKPFQVSTFLVEFVSKE